MNPILIIPIFFGAMILIVGITMVACIPVFKAQARKKARREELKLRIREEKEYQKLNQQKAKIELELETQKAQSILQIEKEKNAIASFCKYCGSKHESNAKHCSNCGASLN